MGMNLDAKFQETDTQFDADFGEVLTLKGDKGDTGSKGDKGDPGYTPVKGVDYFTEDDKAEIVEAVAQDVLPECSNALKATASGETVRIDDVSPLAHIANVSVRGKNLIPTFTQDYSVTRGELTQSCEAGGNTITINGIGNTNGGGRNNFRDYTQHFFLKKGKTYTLSQQIVSGSCDGVFSVYISKTPDSDSVTWISNSMDKKTFVAQEDMECYIGVNVVSGVVYNNVAVRFQLEEGDTATEYVQYVDPTTITVTRYGADETDNLQTYTPSADGSCEIPSLTPTMTLLTDTPGANIEVEYNQDTSKAMGNVRADLQEMDNVVAELTNSMGDISTALSETVKTVNGQPPDENGNVQIETGVGISVKKIVFTDRPSLFQWLLDNYHKVIYLDNINDIAPWHVKFMVHREVRVVDGVHDLSIDPRFNLVQISAQPEKTLVPSYIRINDSYIEYRIDEEIYAWDDGSARIRQVELQTIPDEYWSHFNIVATVYYFDE